MEGGKPMTNKFMTDAARLIACLLAVMILIGAGAGSVTRAFAEGESADPAEGTQSNAGRAVSYQPSTDPIDLAKLCELKVFPCGETSDYWDDAITAQMTYDLYKIAAAAEITGIDSYDYDYDSLGVFASLKTDIQNARIANKDTEGHYISNNAAWDAIAQKAAAIIKGSSTITPVLSAEKEAGADSAVISGSAFLPGLYLIVPHTDADDYWEELETDGTEGSTVLVSTAYSDTYYYYYQPLIISMPHKRDAVPTSSADPNPDPVMTSDAVGWYYGLNVYLKPTQEPRSADLWIMKTLLDYHVDSDAIFDFQVDAVRNGINVYSKAFSVLFRKTEITYYADDNNNVNGIRFTVARDVPVGATVTVTEKYKGSSCVPVGAVTYTGTMTKDGLMIDEDTVLQPVPFVNKGSGYNGGGGIENTYTYGTTQSGGEAWDNGSGNYNPGVSDMTADDTKGK